MRQDSTDELAMGYLDGALDSRALSELNERLRMDPDARAHLRDISFHALALADLSRSAVLPKGGGEKMTARLAVPRINMRRRWAAIAIGGAAALVALALYFPQRPNEIVSELTVQQVTGAVKWTGPDGASINALEPGLILQSGTLSVEGQASSVQIAFADRTVLKLNGDTDATIGAESPKKVHLRSGMLTAEVTPQLRGAAMIFTTPTASVEVLGTRLAIASQESQTRLEVEKGLVRFTRLVDGAGVDVGSGQSAVAGLDAGTSFVQSPAALPASTFRWTFATPPSASWYGEWLAGDSKTPGRMKGKLDIRERKKDGTPLVAYVVSVRDNSAGIASVTPESVLRIRYRVSSQDEVMALVGLHNSKGGFAGNLQWNFQPGSTSPDEPGWRTWQVQLSSHETYWPGKSMPKEGKVFLIYLACFASKANLEVSEIAIDSLSNK